MKHDFSVIWGMGLLLLALMTGCFGEDDDGDTTGGDTEIELETGDEDFVEIDTPAEEDVSDSDISGEEDLSEEELVEDDMTSEQEEENTPIEAIYEGEGNLIWQNSASGMELDWASSKSYCENLTWAGYDDWRLPTLAELRALVRGCDYTVVGGDCQVDDGCLDLACQDLTYCNGCQGATGPDEDGCYRIVELEGPCDRTWSSDLVENDVNNRYWEIVFHTGGIIAGNTAVEMQVRCVRQ